MKDYRIGLKKKNGINIQQITRIIKKFLKTYKKFTVKRIEKKKKQ